MISWSDGLGEYTPGMTACARNKCLYLSNYNNDSVHRVELPGSNAVKKWSVASHPLGLSANRNRNSRELLWAKLPQWRRYGVDNLTFARGHSWDRCKSHDFSGGYCKSLCLHCLSLHFCAHAIWPLTTVTMRRVDTTPANYINGGHAKLRWRVLRVLRRTPGGSNSN